MSKTWEDRADTFAALDEGDGWPFAVEVACSVEKGQGNGLYDQEASAVAEAPISSKVSAAKFARRAGTNDKRVARYLAAWDFAASEPFWSVSAGQRPLHDGAGN